jgi:hypothetical protein
VRLVISPSTSPTAFNLYGIDRLAEWKRFREELESSPDPLHDVVKLWSKAPFVSPYLDPSDSSSWPDPWRLIIDLKLDHLAIVLGMLYTLQLTKRFMNSRFEIHMSMPTDRKDPDYFLSVERLYLLDHQNCSITPYFTHLNKIWSSDKI